jgi:hypothetical protein
MKPGFSASKPTIYPPANNPNDQQNNSHSIKKKKEPAESKNNTYQYSLPAAFLP